LKLNNFYTKPSITYTSPYKHLYITIAIINKKLVKRQLQ